MDCFLKADRCFVLFKDSWTSASFKCDFVTGSPDTAERLLREGEGFKSIEFTF